MARTLLGDGASLTRLLVYSAAMRYEKVSHISILLVSLHVLLIMNLFCIINLDGYAIEHEGLCVTVFSAPNYVDQSGNKGAFVRDNFLSLL